MKIIEARAYEIADRILSQESPKTNIREELKAAVLIGYNLHQEDFDDEEK